MAINKKCNIIMPDGEIVERTVYEYRFGYMIMLVARHKNRHWFIEKDGETDRSCKYRAIRKLTLEEFCYINPFCRPRRYFY